MQTNANIKNSLGLNYAKTIIKDCGLNTMTDHSISEKIEYNVHKKELSQNRKWMFPFCNSSFYDSFIESA